MNTVQFALDGATYEIDLSDSNANRLRDALADYVGAARRTGGRVRRNVLAKPAHNPSKVREWAQKQGIELAARGRIPAHVMMRFQEAQENPPAPRRKAVAAAAKKTAPTKRRRR